MTKRKAVETRGRPKLGDPISVTLTNELRKWLDSKIPQGDTSGRSGVIRRILQAVKADEEHEAVLFPSARKRKA